MVAKVQPQFELHKAIDRTSVFSRKQDFYLVCRDRRPRRSKVVSVTAAHPSVAQKRDLQKPSLVREGGPLAVDE